MTAIEAKNIIQNITENLGYEFASVWTPLLDSDSNQDFPCVYWMDPTCNLRLGPQGQLFERWTLRLGVYDQTLSGRTSNQRDEAHAKALEIAKNIIYEFKSSNPIVVGGREYDLTFIGATHVNEWDSALDMIHGPLFELTFDNNAVVCYE